MAIPNNCCRKNVYAEFMAHKVELGRWVDYRAAKCLEELGSPIAFHHWHYDSSWNCYKPQAEVIELHVFSDASKSAYGLAAYLRIISNSEAFVSLQSSKSKVAALKLLSIPRLELAAMDLSSKISKHFIKESQFEYTSVHLWTDSMDVLFWLQSQPSRLVTFVANRCSSILENCPEASFYHVKSKDNPADIVSRGCSVNGLHSSALWWSGPVWDQTTIVSDPGVWGKVRSLRRLVWNQLFKGVE